MFLGTYLTPINEISNQKCAIISGIWKPLTLKIRIYEARLTEINDYLDLFTGSYVIG